MQHPLLAEECLRGVLQLEKSVKEDTYLFPCATVELALLARDQGDIQLAISFLEDAKLVWILHYIFNIVDFYVGN